MQATVRVALVLALALASLDASIAARGSRPEAAGAYGDEQSLECVKEQCRMFGVNGVAAVA